MNHCHHLTSVLNAGTNDLLKDGQISPYLWFTGKYLLTMAIRSQFYNFKKNFITFPTKTFLWYNAPGEKMCTLKL